MILEVGKRYIINGEKIDIEKIMFNRRYRMHMITFVNIVTGIKATVKENLLYGCKLYELDFGA